MSGFFSDFDLANAADDPFDFEDGIYEGTVLTGIEMREGTKDRKDDDGNTVSLPFKGLSVDFTTPKDGKYNHYFSFPMEGDSAMAIKFKKAGLKSLLKGCNIPTSRMNTVQPDELIGSEMTMILKTGKNGFKNIDLRSTEDNSSTDEIPSFDVSANDFVL